MDLRRRNPRNSRTLLRFAARHGPSAAAAPDQHTRQGQNRDELALLASNMKRMINIFGVKLLVKALTTLACRCVQSPVALNNRCRSRTHEHVSTHLTFAFWRVV